jgi:hypothetical protein
MKLIGKLGCACLAGALVFNPAAQGAEPGKKVKVFVLLGQSNMVGMGNVGGDKEGSLEKAVKTEKLYQYLLDASGGWAERNDVRYVQVMVGRGGGMNVLHNEWLKVGKGKIGVEFGFGHQVGNVIEEPVMILKSCIGNRALGWDLLPPGSKGFEFTTKDKTGKDVTWVHPGYKETPERWEKGTKAEPAKYGWYAGKQYDDDVANAKKVLSELGTYCPGAAGYEVAGFLWWQGERDCGSEALSSRYEQNLVAIIKSLRKDFDAPNAKFVMATLGEAKKGLGGNTEKDGKSGKYPEFKGNVATVYTHDMARGGSGNGHYGGNAKVYMDVGEAMGKTMVELLKGGK